MAPTAWRAGPDEAETIARLLVAFRDHNGHDWPSDNAFLASVEKLVERTDTEFLLASPSEDSPPEGVCQLRFRFSVWTASDDCWLEDLYVTDEARGTGLGRALIETAFERARARGCGRIQLDVAEDNLRAIEVYRSAGFGTEPGAPGRTMLITRRL
jgi:GNAT superfamily N-acetyltransferase